jgi:drug/metabolite transporter (DMT)-like permease
VAKTCALCGVTAPDAAAFAEHMRQAHAWDQAAAPDRPMWIHPVILIALMLLMPVGWAVLGVLVIRHADGGLDMNKTDHLLAVLAIPLAISFYFWGPPLAGAPHDDQGLGTGLLLLAVAGVAAAIIAGTRFLRLWVRSHPPPR